MGGTGGMAGRGGGVDSLCCVRNRRGSFSTASIAQSRGADLGPGQLRPSLVPRSSSTKLCQVRLASERRTQPALAPTARGVLAFPLDSPHPHPCSNRAAAIGTPEERWLTPLRRTGGRQDAVVGHPVLLASDFRSRCVFPLFTSFVLIVDALLPTVRIRCRARRSQEYLGRVRLVSRSKDQAARGGTSIASLFLLTFGR